MTFPPSRRTLSVRYTVGTASRQTGPRFTRGRRKFNYVTAFPVRLCGVERIHFLVEYLLSYILASCTVISTSPLQFHRKRTKFQVSEKLELLSCTVHNKLQFVSCVYGMVNLQTFLKVTATLATVLDCSGNGRGIITICI